MTEIVKVEESHKADYMALFLLADPSEKMVAKYLGRGDVCALCGRRPCLCCRSDGLRPRHVRAEKFGDG